MKSKNMQEFLKEVLGNEAFDSTDFQVSPNTQKLCKIVNYCYTQIQFSEREAVGEDKVYLKTVLKNIDEMVNE